VAAEQTAPAERRARVTPGRHAPVDRTGVRSVYVWEWPVRVTHWVIVAAIVALSFTGWWLHDPFFEPSAPAGPGASPGFTLGLMRFLHELAAAAFIAALLGRMYWAVAGNRYARFTALLPLTPQQRQGLRETLAYYALRRGPPRAIGHNPLAGISYIVLWLGFWLSILTGLSLFTWIVDREPWTTFFGWTWSVLTIQHIRLVHFLLMFAFMAFAVHHVYSAVLVDREERNGELSSIVTGWKLDYGEDEEDDV
jgi:Ni/Fe-hydrogenase 1 B-type cytochrome subunit